VKNKREGVKGGIKRRKQEFNQYAKKENILFSFSFYLTILLIEQIKHRHPTPLFKYYGRNE
jgi:hypothetical protein